MSDLFPVVTATGKRDRSKRSPEEMPGAPADQLRGDFYDVGFDASWEVSLFGRGMRGVQAQNAFRDAAIANLWGTQVAVTAEVARNYFELRGLQARRDVVLKNADGQKAALDIARASVDAGRSSELDLQRAIAQYESTLATVPRIDTAITRTSYRIAVLTGRTPHDVGVGLVTFVASYVHWDIARVGDIPNHFPAPSLPLASPKTKSCAWRPAWTRAASIRSPRRSCRRRVIAA